MLSFVRRRLTFANVALTVALVFAMSGGAFAAGKFLITSAKQIKPSVLASLKGKAGASGAPGAAGATGPAGPAGSQGPKGDVGPAGAGGSNGSSAEATSFVGTKTIGSVTCGEGGLLVKSATAETLVCNGKKGAQGAPGAAGAIHPGEQLPSGASETGAWGLSGQPVKTEGTEVVLSSISFPIPLAKASRSHVILVGESLPSGCSGSVAAPGAEPGNVCIFAAKEQGLSVLVPVEPAANLAAPEKAGPTGAVLAALPASGAVNVTVYGTWAVTAE